MRNASIYSGNKPCGLRSRSQITNREEVLEVQPEVINREMGIKRPTTASVAPTTVNIRLQISSNVGTQGESINIQVCNEGSQQAVSRAGL